MAQTSTTKMKMPNAMFELGVHNENTQVNIEQTFPSYKKIHVIYMGHSKSNAILIIILCLNTLLKF